MNPMINKITRRQYAYSMLFNCRALNDAQIYLATITSPVLFHKGIAKAGDPRQRPNGENDARYWKHIDDVPAKHLEEILNEKSYNEKGEK